MTIEELRAFRDRLLRPVVPSEGDGLKHSGFPAGWSMAFERDEGRWFAHCGRSSFWHRTQSWVDRSACIDEAIMIAKEGVCLD